jgi:HAD superfamily hydrolase (TIGR01509 family)
MGADGADCQMKDSLRGLIFDVDGTLADTEEVHRQAFNRVFARHGLAWHWTPECYEALLVVSGGRERMIRYAHQVDPALAARSDFESFVRRLHREKTACYAEMLVTGQVALRPGVERLLCEARDAGLLLGIATSSAWSNLKTLLDCNLPAEWPSWFQAIETCDSVEEKKPSPAVYLAVLRRLGTLPVQTMAVEDTENGLRAARAAGLVTLITAHRFTRNGQFPNAAAVLDGLGDAQAPAHARQGPACPRGFVDLGYLRLLLGGDTSAASEARDPAPGTPQRAHLACA